MAEGEVAGPGQQGWEAPAVQRGLWQEHQGVYAPCNLCTLIIKEIISHANSMAQRVLTGQICWLVNFFGTD